MCLLVDLSGDTSKHNNAAQPDDDKPRSHIQKCTRSWKLVAFVVVFPFDTVGFMNSMCYVHYLANEMTQIY